MSSVFNRPRFITAVNSLDLDLVTSYDLDLACASYAKVQKSALSIFGDHFGDTFTSLSSLSDRIIEKLGAPKKCTIVVELIVLRFFLEEIVDTIQSGSQNRAQDSEIPNREGLLRNSICWEQGSVRSNSGQRKVRKTNSM
jgi:hypothetical protein